MSSENNKRIAKNTLMLYFRMLVTMIVSLITVRIVLDTLGVVDYGVYNVVGGMVTMFSFLSGTMASASQRFFAFEIGKNNHGQLKKIFSVTMTIYVLLAAIILILSETVGLWFLENKMTIPSERMNAARWVYQLSVLSFIVTIFSIPYNAAVIAHEKMNVYAYVSIIEVVLKLVIVYLLIISPYDKLIIYAGLIFCTTLITTIIYRVYARRVFPECRYSFYWNTSLFKEILSYSGWNLFGSLSGIMKDQGINILLNIFFGPAVNAARGIAFQVSSMLNKFVQNFMIAVRPQIIKYYAKKEMELLYKLVFQSSKFSFFLLFTLSIPVLLETNFLFSLWLKEVPSYVVLFSRLVILNAVVDSFTSPLGTSVLATGKIKKYQIVTGGTLLLNFPVSYIFLKLGFSPQSTMYIAIVFSLIGVVLRLVILDGLISFPVRKYFKDVILRSILSTVPACIIPWLILLNLEEGFIRFLLVSISSIIFSIITIYSIGLSRYERHFVIQVIKKKLKLNSNYNEL